MGFFKKLFKGAGNVLKKVATVATPLLGVAASFLPGGAAISSLVTKLIPAATPAVQEQALQFISQAATLPSLTPTAAIAQAAELKQQLISVGVPAEQASSAGAIMKAASQAAPNQAVSVLQTIDANIPDPAANGFMSKEEVKAVVTGVLDGARSGAVDAYLDKTESGKAAKADAIESQGNKILPFILLGLMAVLFFFRPKGR